MVHMEDERLPSGTSTGESPSAVRYADARKRWICQMGMNALQAAAQSDKVSNYVYKDKQVHHQRQVLEQIIDELADKQHGLCALTRLPLQWGDDAEDSAMIASLDRIDSGGDYIYENR